MTDPSYPNTPPEVLEAIQRIVPALPGWTSVPRCQEMADAIMETRPKICVELGVFGGRSLVAQAIALKHANYGGVVAGIDPWKTEHALEDENEANRQWWSVLDIEAIQRKAVSAVWDNRLEEQAVIIRSASQHAAPLFTDVDYLYIDANHSEVASTRDVETWVPKVQSGGYIFADDANWPSTQKAYARLKEMADLVKIGSEVAADGTVTHGTYLVLRKK